MSHISNIELENLRHFIGDLTLKAAKCQTYAQQCNDPQLRNYFNSSAQMESHALQTLKQFLN
ncbi:MAG: hypothetical protein APF76_06930 [Desulfitibacter sp. BRH_c19]|nr:MAG: hypothetical protein APF76_06930 [Desulfitibacter sp. BRH_c19]